MCVWVTGCTPDCAGLSSVQALLFAQQPPASKNSTGKLSNYMTAMKVGGDNNMAITTQ
jgi:hypothetical protein